MTFDIERLLEQLDRAYKDNDVDEVLKINELIQKGEEDTTEDEINKEFIQSIKNKPVYKNLTKIVNEEPLEYTDTLKLLSSIITHMIIESDVRKKNIKLYPIKCYQDLLQKLIDDKGELENANQFLLNKYKKLI